MPSQRVFHTRPVPRLKYPTTLAQFKAWLQQPGVMMACVHHDLCAPHQAIQAIQSVDNLGWTFATGQRCLFRSARAWSFDGDRASFILSPETLHQRVGALVIYKLINPN